MSDEAVAAGTSDHEAVAAEAGAAEARDREAQAALAAYQDYLCACGYRPEAATERCWWVAPLILRAKAEGLEAACRSLRAITMELRREGMEDDLAKTSLHEMKAFVAWLGGERPALTAERVAYLEGLAGKAGAALPARLPLEALQGLLAGNGLAAAQDGCVILLVGTLGLSAEDVCALRVGDFSLPGRSLTVRSRVLREQSLSDSLANTLTLLVLGRGADEPLVTNGKGEALEPKALRKRLTALWKTLAGVDATWTLERLRDHAARGVLSSGFGWDEVAQAMGLADARAAKRRFAGEAWEYCADRDGQWFTLEAVAQAEAVAADQLREWMGEGLPHLEREGRVYLRRPDLYVFGEQLPADGDGDGAEGSSGERRFSWEPQVTVDQAEALLQFGAVLQDEARADERQAAYAAFAATVGREEERDGAWLMGAIGEVGRAGLDRLARARKPKARPEDALQRACTAAGLKTAPQPPEDMTYEGLRSALIGSSSELRVLAQAVQTAQAGEPGDPLAEGARGLLHTPPGVTVLYRALSDPAQAVWFWLLVDRRWATFQNARNAARAYYVLGNRAAAELLPGCAPYAFFVAVLVAGPSALQLVAHPSADSLEDLLAEAMVQWLAQLLVAARAIPLNTRGDRLFGPSPRSLPSEAQFQREFIAHWDGSEKFRRRRWSYWALLALSAEDTIRFCYHSTARGSDTSRRVRQEVRAYLLYQAKLPPQALLLHPAGRDAQFRLDLLYLAHLHLLQREWARMLRGAATTLGSSGDDLSELVPPDAAQQVRELCHKAAQAFDYSRGAVQEGRRTAFWTYLSKHLEGYLKTVSVHLAKAAVDTGSSLQEATARGDEELDTWFPGLYLPMHLVGTTLAYHQGTDGEQYVTAATASILRGWTRRRLQQLGPELGARRAEEVFPDAVARLEEGLARKQWLFPVGCLFPRRKP
jgi:site-specific recombinase XerC